MKLSILEPLGIDMAKLRSMADESVGGRMEIVCYDSRVEDAETLIERSRDSDVVVLSNFKYSREVMSHCPNLKMVCVAFTGVDHVDLEYCRDHQITVCNCAGYSTVAVADLVFGMVISLARNIPQCDAAVRSGGTKDGLVGFELEGKTFGVVGLGAIGQRVAKIASAFGCNVLGYNRSPKQIEGVKQVVLEELLANSDIVSLHIPQTSETVGLINRERLSLMKKNAFLINTARGPIVDSEALAWALKENIIAGAAVDVFEKEPPIAKEHPLFSAPHLLATPHVAFASKQAFEKRAVIVFENIIKWLDGKPQNVIK
ncbi:MAG: 2-hydroxyacid dehydrogenase [Clostridiaceae bacterium]|nr:2-hydroxyacid dehydrogenase [Clostridiaceae bacterium]